MDNFLFLFDYADITPPSPEEKRHLTWAEMPSVFHYLKGNNNTKRRNKLIPPQLSDLFDSCKVHYATRDRFYHIPFNLHLRANTQVFVFPVV